METANLQPENAPLLLPCHFATNSNNNIDRTMQCNNKTTKQNNAKTQHKYTTKQCKENTKTQSCNDHATTQSCNNATMHQNDATMMPHNTAMQ